SGQPCGACRLAQRQSQPGKPLQRPCEAGAVSHFPEESQALLQQRAPCRKVTLLPGRKAARMEPPGPPTARTPFLGARHARLAEGGSSRIVTFEFGPNPQAMQRFGHTRPVVQWACEVEAALEAGARFCKAAFQLGHLSKPEEGREYALGIALSFLKGK